MRPAVQTVADRPNETMQYWRHRDLGDATLMCARYGPFNWDKHVHDEQVIVLTESGAGEVETRRGRDIGSAGSVWVFMPGEYHFGRVDLGGSWQYRALYLDEHVLERIGRQLGIKTNQGLLLRPGLHHDPDLAHMLLRAHASRVSERASEQEAWSEALSELYARYGDPPPADSKQAVRAAAVRLAQDYILEHFRDDISIDDLAGLTNVSRFHFIRSFRASIGIPPHAYINQVRVQHARKLLVAGWKASEAAIESGFYDQSKLNRLFKRSYGVTPAHYAHLARL